MNKVILVDFSWLFVRLYYVNNSNKEHIDGTTRYIKALSKMFDKTFIVLDGENGSFKKRELLPSYKEGRSNKEEIYKNLEPTLKKVLEQTNITICRNKNREADEVIAAIAVRLSRKNKVIIFSGDKDMLQLAYLPNISIANTFKNGKVSVLSDNEILSKFNVSKLEDVLKLRVFKGDTSDKIKPPIPRLMKKYIDVILSEWKTNSLTEEIFNNILEHIEDNKLKDKLTEAKENIFTNYKLMNLYDKEEHIDILKHTKQIKTIDK